MKQLAFGEPTVQRCTVPYLTYWRQTDRQTDTATFTRNKLSVTYRHQPQCYNLNKLSVTYRRQPQCYNLTIPLIHSYILWSLRRAAINMISLNVTLWNFPQNVSRMQDLTLSLTTRTDRPSTGRVLTSTLLHNMATQI